MWISIDQLAIIWKSDLFVKIKQDFFQAAAVSLLLYGYTSLVLIKCMEKKLDGNYTGMLHTVLNKFWKHHFPKQQLYGHFSQTIQVRWTRHAGHCWRSKDKLISYVLLWISRHWCATVGWPPKAYIRHLCVNTGCRLENYCKWCMIGMDDEKGSENTVFCVCVHAHVYACYYILMSRVFWKTGVQSHIESYQRL